MAATAIPRLDMCQSPQQQTAKLLPLLILLIDCQQCGREERRPEARRGHRAPGHPDALLADRLQRRRRRLRYRNRQEGDQGTGREHRLRRTQQQVCQHDRGRHPPLRMATCTSSAPTTRRAVNALHGRWFASKVITAAYIPLVNYHNFFPHAAAKSMIRNGMELNHCSIMK